MNNYTVIGESRQVGAIGIYEPFSISTISDNAKTAYENVRSQLYASNREHVHVKEIKLKMSNHNYVIVSPSAYL